MVGQPMQHAGPPERPDALHGHDKSRFVGDEPSGGQGWGDEADVASLRGGLDVRAGREVDCLEMLHGGLVHKARFQGQQIGLRRIGTEGFGQGVPIGPGSDHDGEFVMPLRPAPDVDRDESRMRLDPRKPALANERVELSSATLRDANAQDPDDHSISRSYAMWDRNRAILGAGSQALRLKFPAVLAACQAS